jgi:hypothetical protein
MSLRLENAYSRSIAHILYDIGQVLEKQKKQYQWMPLKAALVEMT